MWLFVLFRDLLAGAQFGLRLIMAGEAEASSAGEQLAEDYPAGTHRTDGARKASLNTASAPFFPHRDDRFPMPRKTHAASAALASLCAIRV